jgi:cytochrome c biogenesis protein CcmG/thiol:disulfide interchange protein DsbE
VILRRLLPLIVFLALASLLGAGIWLSRNPDREALPSTLIGKRAPGFELPLLATDASESPSAATASSAAPRIVRSAEFAGAPYVLNVWGSWCVNCREEHPVVAELAKRGIVKVIGYDYHDDPEDAQRWLAQFGDPYALVVSDVEGRTALDWGIYGAPETYLVDAQGIVRWKHVGPLTDEIVAHELLPLLAKTGAKP